MKILIIPLVAAVIAQISKVFIKQNHQKLSWSILWAYSGMPSGNAAITSALTTIIGLEEGITYPGFSIALVFTLLTLRDATGVRRQLGNQGGVINKLVDDLDDDNYLDKRYPHLTEKIGHTPKQTAAGVILGLVIALIGYFLF